MENEIRSIRTFIGATDYQVSRGFYLDWGFEEVITSPKLSYFYLANVGFYLQDYDVKDWINNSMLFLEVDNLQAYWKHLKAKKLDAKFEKVKLVEPKSFEWGSEGFIYDPSGILWHIGSFKQ